MYEILTSWESFCKTSKSDLFAFLENFFENKQFLWKTPIFTFSLFPTLGEEQRLPTLELGRRFIPGATCEGLRTLEDLHAFYMALNSSNETSRSDVFFKMFQLYLAYIEIDMEPFEPFEHSEFFEATCKKAWLGVAILPILQLLEATRGFSNQSSLKTLSFQRRTKISNIKALTFELTLTFLDSIDASSSSINLSEDTSSHKNHLVSLNVFISESWKRPYIRPGVNRTYFFVDDSHSTCLLRARYDSTDAARNAASRPGGTGDLY